MTLLIRNVGSNMYSIVDNGTINTFTDDEVDIINLLEDIKDYVSTGHLISILYKSIE